MSGDLSLLSGSTVQWIQYAVVLLGFVGSMYTVYRIGNKGSFKQLAPYYAFMVFLMVANIYLFSLPMMHRV